MLLTFLEKLPLSQSGKVFVGTSLCLAICAYPVVQKRTLQPVAPLACLPSNSHLCFLSSFSPSVL